MRALITIHHLWFATAECAFEALKNKAFLERAGQFIVDHFTAVLIEDIKQVHESLPHPQIRNVGSSDLIRPVNG
ncbi:hypothetical protein [Paenibacillus larvae]|uniref:hypothetical protein n=1 Tax=Paenibacillus larvae TaxID=1464 RepID=UPI00398A84F3